MIDVVINPVAGNGYALKQAQKVVQYLDAHRIEHRAWRTTGVGHATQLARRAAQEGIPRLLCVGGDGTMLEVARGLVGSRVALGVIPAGTGNDFATTLGLPKRIEDLMDALMAAQARPVDIGLYNDRAFLNIIGSGFDVEVLRWTLHFKRWVRGMLPYMLGVIMTIFSHKDIHIDLTADGRRTRERLLLIAVANGKSYGGGMKVARDARIDDGMLDLILVHSVSKWRIPFLLPRFVSGSFVSLPFVEHRLVRSVAIEGAGLSFNVDGEIFDDDRARVELSGEKLWISMP